MEQSSYVYILASGRNGTLYTGVTAHLSRRIHQHRAGRVPGFTQTYGVKRLVYPGEADIAVGKVSVLSPVGAGLLGLKAGQSIQWPDRDGRLRALRVLKVSRG